MRCDRSLSVAALAIFCCFLVASAQPVQAVFPAAIAFVLGIGLGFLVSWIVDTFKPPAAGVTIPDHISLFYNSKKNEIDAITTNTLTMASLVNETGFYLGRKAQIATMNYINSSSWTDQIKWAVLWESGVLNETGQLYAAISEGYANVIKDCIRYSTNFVGTYSSMDFKLNSTSTKSWSNFSVRLMFTCEMPFGNANSMGSITKNYYVVGPCRIMHYYKIDWGSGSTQGSVTVTSLVNGSTVYSWSAPNNTDHESSAVVNLPEGIYSVTFYAKSNYYTGSTYNYYGYLWGIDGLILSPYPSDGVNFRIYAYQTSVAYSSMTFSESVNNTSYTINANNTIFALWTLRSNLDTTINFAATLAQSYYTTLRNLGYTDPSKIPANYTIPPVDVIFISNEDMNRLSAAEVYALYIAYLKALGQFFTLTNYQSIVAIEPANVTFANMAVKIIGSMSRNGTVYTNGTLYLQVYQNLTIAVNQTYVMNSSGLVYNLDQKRVFTYQPGDVLNVTDILVYDPTNQTGYTRVANATISPMTVDIYIHTSDSGTPTGQNQTTTTTASWADQLKGLKWYLLGGAVFILLIIFAPVLNEAGKQWVRAWR